MFTKFNLKPDVKLCALSSLVTFLSGSTYSQIQVRDTLKCTGSVAITGLVQTGDENRTVFSLLSALKLGTTRYEIEPLTSIAYSTKPGKKVEAEYLENIVLRLHQHNKFYPALGVAAEYSFLRKINLRYTLSAAVVCNLIRQHEQSLKFAIGYSYEFSKYAEGAFIPPIANEKNYSRLQEQIYMRMKGENKLKQLKISYDIFYQLSFKDLSDNRWFVIGNLDYLIAKHLSVRVSALGSFEDFTAINVSKNNFRLTYGINFQF